MEPNTEQNKNPAEKPKIAIQTYASDMADAIKENQGSVIKIAAAEEARRQKVESVFSPASPKNKMYIMLSIIVIVLALVVIGVAMYLKNSSEPVVTDEPTSPTIVSIVKSESHTPYEITNKTPNQIESELNIIANSPDTVKGTIEDIYMYVEDEIGKHLISGEDFINALATSASPEFLRSLQNEYMLGIHKHKDFSQNSIFLILKTETYQSGFAGMLAWENILFDDLYSLFGIDVSGDKRVLFEQKWTDATIKNKDARALKDGTGNIVMFYTFLDDTTLLITTSPDTLEEVTSRYFQNTLVR